MKLLLLALFFVGCGASGYQSSYTSFNDHKRLSDAIYLEKDQQVKLYGVDDFQTSSRMALAKGYIPIGKSAFNGVQEGKDAIVAQAKRVGATHVLVNKKFTSTQITATPMYAPTYSGYYYGGYSYYGGYGGYMTTEVTVDKIYDQAAIFFVKTTRKFALGIYFKDLTDESKKQIERNVGAIVDVVVEDTPAFKANILVGDIILSVDSVEVKDASAISKLIDDQSKEDKKIALEIFRKDTTRTIEVTLDK